MDRQKGKIVKFEEATWNVTTENLPFLHFVKPLKGKAGLSSVASYRKPCQKKSNKNKL